MKTTNTRASEPKPLRQRYTVRASINTVVSSKLPSSAIAWKRGCSAGIHAACIPCATCMSRLVKRPAVIAMVRAMKTTPRIAMAARRGVNGTGGSPPGSLMLATAAEDCRPAGDPDDTERPSTREARLTRASVDEKLLLLRSGLTPSVAIGVDRAPPIGDRELERFAQRFVKAAGGSFANRVCDPARAQACAVKRLVGVDVAHPRNRTLVEQNRLERGAPLVQAPVQLIGRKVGV